MKSNVLLTILSILSFTLFAQSPEGFNYQAVIRNDNNELVTNQSVTLKISIVDDISVYYSETHNVITNDNGLISLVIGQGNVISGDFQNAFDSENQKSIKVEIDLEGGSNFSLLGTNLLWSVPYANTANKALTVENIDQSQLIWSLSGSNTYFKSGYVGIGTDSPDRSLQININTDGTNGFRSGMIMKNLDSSTGSYMDAVIKSGSDASEAGGGIGTSALSYTTISDFAGYTYVYNVNSGVALKARNTNGKLRFYTGGDDPTYERMTISSTGNVGINNGSPDHLLDVNGTINATEYLLDGNPMNESQWTTNSSNIYYSSGYVGIGTDSPDRSLQINIDTDGTNGYRSGMIMKNLDSSTGSYMDAVIKSGSDASEAGGGIGTSALSYTTISDFAGYTYVYNVNSGVALKARNANGKLRFYTGGDDPTYERMTISSTGNVGINNGSPNYLLDVNGTINATEYLLDGNPMNESQWTTNSSNIYYSNGYVGIGTDSPDRSLEINIDTDGTNGYRSGLIMKNLDSSTGSYMDAVVKSGSGASEAGGGIGTSALSYTTISDFAGYTYVYNVNNGVALKARNANGKLRFYTGGDDPTYERMTINSSGNVGIDNGSPVSKLQVSNGDVYIDEIGSGVIMKSPDGNCWRMTVDNSGNPVFTSITCPN